MKCAECNLWWADDPDFPCSCHADPNWPAPCEYEISGLNWDNEDEDWFLDSDYYLGV